MDTSAFNQGWDAFAYRWLGSHVTDTGVDFRVWAPDAQRVHVLGDFNAWNRGAHEMFPIGDSGVWTCSARGAKSGDRYKYAITTRDGRVLEKADPMAQRHEEAPRTASIVYRSQYEWEDAQWASQRRTKQPHREPAQIYELHLGSWRHLDGRVRYRDIAKPLAEYLNSAGFTHVEILPLMEHPFYGSWGYQVTGHFAPTARYGEPDDLRYLIDHLHQQGIGVLLDWVPAHFPTDAHGLAQFDGTALYEHADPKRGWHPDWNTHIFNYGRNEVRSFLLSSAMYWIEEFHADGLRVDAVASMIYRDYSRAEGEWVPNERGGRENDEAVGLLQLVNETLYAHHPGILMIAEESTAWPGVSRPTTDGGLGFGFKWDMGWMHDTLKHLEREPVHRKFHHDELTFRSVYAGSENYVLALSHDEVVHGKRPLLEKLPGDRWQQFANNRLLWAYQATQPGKSLVFMGMEFGQTTEWNHDEALPWGLLEHSEHQQLLRWTSDLNALVAKTPALYERDHYDDGTRWLEPGRPEEGVMVAARFADDGSCVIVCLNFTPVAREGFRVGVPSAGEWVEALNSDDLAYGGSGLTYDRPRRAATAPAMGEPYSIEVLVPPLGAVFLAAEPANATTGER